MDGFCGPFNFTLGPKGHRELCRCLYGIVLANFFLLLGIGFTINFCLIRRQYSRVSDGVNKKAYNQRTIIIIGATAVSIAFYLLEVFLQFTVIYSSFIPVLFLQMILYVKVQITILLILRRTKELNFFIKMFYFICAVLFSLAFAGYNNAEWYFGRTNRYDNIELAFYGIRLGLSWFMALISWCPDLTVNIHECPDGRLFVPSESKSKLVCAFHRFRYLWSYTWPKSLSAKIQLIMCFTIMISTRVCNVLLPYYSKLIVDKITESSLTDTSLNEVMRLVGVLMTLQMLFSSSGLLTQIQKNILYVTVQQETVRQVQIMTFNHLLHLKYEWHVKRKTGEVLRANDRGANSVTNLLKWICFDIGPTLLDIIIAVVYFWIAFNWIFALLVFVCLGIYIAATIGITDWRTKFRQKMNKKDNDTNARAIDSLLNYEQVKANVNEDMETNLYRDKILTYQKTQLTVQHSLAFLNIAQSVVMIAGQAIGALLCVKYVFNGTFTVGDYVMFGTYIAQLYVPLNMFGCTYKNIQAAFIDTQNLMEILTEKPEPSEPQVPVVLPNKPISMAVQNVSFKYKNDNRQILNDITFEVPAGETWALVGESGCGKSTLSRLFTGLIEPSEGKVLINRSELNKIGRKQLRANVGVVSQDCPLFNASIKDNIMYSNLEASDDDVIKAVTASEFKYEKFEDGLHSMVGERGLALSGGEKQRVAIARVFLKQPNAIILDEATSALDSITESQIQKTFVEMAKGKTCLIIAHRLSTIVHADRILLISNGSILESGTHKSLLHDNGVYASLWNQQLQLDMVESEENNPKAI